MFHLDFSSQFSSKLIFSGFRANPAWTPTIALAVETYFLHCAYRSIFQHLAVVFASDDSMLNRLNNLMMVIIWLVQVQVHRLKIDFAHFHKIQTFSRFLRHAAISRIDPSTLGIRQTFHGVIPRARRELVRIIDVTTPR